MGQSVETLNARHQFLDRCLRAGPQALASSLAIKHPIDRENDLYQPLLLLASARKQFRMSLICEKRRLFEQIFGE
jgi:hypothetical protein